MWNSYFINVCRSFLKLFSCDFWSLRGQSVRFVHCKRIPQRAKIRFVVESALFCFGFHKQIPETLNRSKLLKKQANLRNQQLYSRNPKNFVESTSKY